MPESKTQKDRLKEITAGIEQDIQALFQSERYMQYLQTMSRFHRYSLNNVMLIHAQMPNATHVAGFNKWRDQFGRHVKRGEKGIQIIAPVPYKKKVSEIKLDPDTKAPILDADGMAITEEREVSVPTFRIVSVFDVSQTEGKPLPQLASDLTGNVQQYEVFMEALRRSSPVPIEIQPLLQGTDGFFSPKNQSISIRAGMSEVQTVSAVIHEIAHSKLHNYEKEQAETAAGEENSKPPAQKDRRTEEVEAESISYAVCQYYGIQTGENSFGYIASWSQGKELKELRASLETINKTSSELIGDIDRHFAAICKERGIDPKITAQQAETSKEHEKLYAVDRKVYLHIQTSDTGFDYTLYDMASRRQLDGGQLDTPDITMSAACRKICEMHGLSGRSIDNAPLVLLETLQDQQSEVAEAQAAETDGEKTEQAVAASLDHALEEPMPDPQISIADMEHFGYMDSDMLPLTRDRAMELVERDITVFLLYNDSTEEMAFDTEDIIKHDGLFGITREDWEAIKADIPQRDIESRFMESPQDAFMIYQLRRDTPVELHFARLSELSSPPAHENYAAVYTRELYPDDDTQRILENLYGMLNADRPADFAGHSLSVSDIIALKQNGVVSYHYCDSFEFQELPDFRQPENHLRNAEMALEDDYGMIDGIINNGEKHPTVAELEQQAHSGQPISLMDLAAASQQERQQKRKSVLEQLRQQPANKKLAPKKSTEREI